jgi:anaerobic ribonucleoside-triphosphate reductase
MDNGKIKEIDDKIEKLREDHKNSLGSKCEIYSRIVGYFRNIEHWNIGKKEEFKLREPFKFGSGEEEGFEF